VGSKPTVNRDPSGLGVLTDGNGNVIRWHSYEQLKYQILKLLNTKTVRGEPDSIAIGEGKAMLTSFKQLWSFAQGNLPEKGDGMQFTDVAGKTSTLATFRSKVMVVKSYEVDLSKDQDDAGKLKIREVVDEIKQARGANGAKYSSDLIVYIGHTLRSFGMQVTSQPTTMPGTAPTSQPSGLDAQGIAFLPISCFAQDVLDKSRKYGFAGISDKMTDGLMRNDTLSNIMFMHDAIRGMQIVDKWAREHVKSAPLYIHVIWGSSTPSWQVNVGKGTTTIKLP
jgi:hypothetical protein